MTIKNKGNVSLVGILLVLLTFSGLLIIVTQMQANTEKIKKRSQAYLCYKYLIRTTQGYVKWMGYFNTGIRTIYPFTLIPKTAIQAKTIHKALIRAQGLHHLSYLKKIQLNQLCSVTHTILFIKKVPYKSKLLLKLKRNFDGTVPLRMKKWNIYLPTTHFLLKGKCQLKSAFSRKLNVHTKEINLEDLLNWKDYAGRLL